MQKIITEMVKRIHNTEENTLYATGPRMMTTVIYDHFTNNYLYEIEYIDHNIFMNFIMKQNNIKTCFFSSNFLI